MRSALSLVVLAALALGPASPAPAATWTEARSGIPGYSGLAYGAGQYVLVGSAGHIWSSPDGVTWTRRTNPEASARDLFGVTFAGGQFVAVGANGATGGGNAILTSPDGITWTQRNNAASFLSQLRGVAYGAGLYVAVGSNGPGSRRLITSPDGVTWTAGPSMPAPLRAVTFSGSLFVAVGANRFVTTSPDGLTWTTQPAVPATIPTQLSGVTWTGTSFVAVSFTPFPQAAPIPTGGIITSPDGVTWTQRSAPADNRALQAVTVGGGRLIAVGSGLAGHSVITSVDDGVNWSGVPVSNPLGVSVAGAAVLAGGPAGFVYGGSRGNIYTSPDGLSWTSRTQPNSRTHLGMSHDGTRFCAVGVNGSVARSTDGVSWTEVTTVPDPATYSVWRPIERVGGEFVTVGDSDNVMTSPDCETWTVRNTGTLPAPGLPASIMIGLAQGNGVIVSSGEAYTYTGVDRSQTRLHTIRSTDGGLSWAANDPGLLATNPLNGFDSLSLAFGNGTFVLQASDLWTPAFHLYTSPDGLSWTEQTGLPFDPQETFQQIRFQDGQFVGVGDRIWTSPDGTTWTMRQDFGAFHSAVDFSGGNHVAIGFGGVISSSQDSAVTWAPEPSPTRLSLSTIAHSPQSRFVTSAVSYLAYASFAPFIENVGPTGAGGLQPITWTAGGGATTVDVWVKSRPYGSWTLFEAGVPAGNGTTSGSYDFGAFGQQTDISVSTNGGSVTGNALNTAPGSPSITAITPTSATGPSLITWLAQGVSGNVEVWVQPLPGGAWTLVQTAAASAGTTSVTYDFGTSQQTGIWIAGYGGQVTGTAVNTGVAPSITNVGPTAASGSSPITWTATGISGNVDVWVQPLPGGTWTFVQSVLASLGTTSVSHNFGSAPQTAIWVGANGGQVVGTGLNTGAAPPSITNVGPTSATGMAPITWTATSISGNVDVWVLPIPGGSWTFVQSVAAAAGTTSVNYNFGSSPQTSIWIGGNGGQVVGTALNTAGAPPSITNVGPTAASGSQVITWTATGISGNVDVWARPLPAGAWVFVESVPASAGTTAVTYGFGSGGQQSEIWIGGNGGQIVGSAINTAP